MGIEPRFNMSDLNSYMDERLQLLENLILRNLNYLGMQCVNLAKSLNTYTDRTGNLRNSIGYIIVKNGTVVDSKFNADERGPEYQNTDLKGEVVGEEYAKELAKNYSTGYVLIVVAGMNYASYVEDIHHLDVLQPAKTYSESNLNRIAQNIVESMQS